MRDPFSRLSTWYFSKKSLPYWGIILLDCCLILFSGLLVYTLNNGVLSTLDILGHLLVTLLVCLIPYLVGFRLFHTYSGIIRYSSFVDLQKVGFTALSVDTITNFLVPYFTDKSAITRVPSTLLRTLSSGLSSIIGTCL